MWTHFVSEHHACKRERGKKFIFEPCGCAHSVFPYTQDVALWCGRERRKEQHILGKRRAVGSFWRVGALLHLLEKGGGGIPFSSLFPSKLTGNELLLNPSFHRPSSLHLFLSGELLNNFGECFFPLFTLFLDSFFKNTAKQREPTIHLLYTWKQPPGFSLTKSQAKKSPETPLVWYRRRLILPRKKNLQ